MTVTSRSATVSSSLWAEAPSTAATWLEVWVTWPAEQEASASAERATAEITPPRRATDFRDFTGLSSMRSCGKTHLILTTLAVFTGAS